MTLYARSDMSCVAISVDLGGCGNRHSRPVIQGAPAKTFKLDCPQCESVLRGDRKPRILKHIIDGGRVVGQERVADADPMWSSTPDSVPLTPDEERTDARFRETAQLQIDAMNALGTAISNKLQIPAEMMHLLRKQLPAEMLSQIPGEMSIPGSVVCGNGHDVQAGLKFCGECGISMAAKAAIGGSDDYEAGSAVADLGRLHPQTLRKMCRDKSLPDRGSKEQLIQRLQAA